MDFFDCSFPEAAGFALFSPAHLLWLLFCAGLAAGLCLLYKRAGSGKRRRFRRGLGLAVLTLELLRALVLFSQGAYDLGRLPLHLCSMAVFLTFFHGFWGGELTGQFLYALCLPGAAAALLLPDWRNCPPLCFMSCCGFTLHALTAAYPLMLLSGRDLRPDPGSAPLCLGLLLLLAGPVYLFDILTGTNYMFLNWPPEATPLAWFAFLGRPGSLLGYPLLIAAVWALLYLPFRKKA